ncbi:MAG: type II toxin-antitoxin system RelE/ParE family toxin [Limisphaerales bacterium]
MLTVAFAVTLNGASPGLKFYEERSVQDKARLLKLFKLLGDRGWIKNEQKFKPLGTDKFFEFKDFQIRMPCFRDGGTMVITHGFLKKRDAIPPVEIERAKRIRDQDTLVAQKRAQAKNVQ